MTDSDKTSFESTWEDMPYRPLFDCPKCKGGGFIHPSKPDGSVDYWKVVFCNHPGCYGDQAAAYKRGDLVQQSGVIGTKQTFETFDTDVPGVKKNNGRFTIVATNRDIGELPPRLKSRFQDKHLSRAVLNEAVDYRLKRGR